jgi:hypothetical protein
MKNYSTNELPIESFQPWVEAFIRIGDICDPEFDGMCVEDYRVRLLLNLGNEIRDSTTVCTRIGARWAIGKLIDSTIEPYEGFPYYERSREIGKRVVGPLLGGLYALRGYYKSTKSIYSTLDSVEAGIPNPSNMQ